MKKKLLGRFEITALLALLLVLAAAFAGSLTCFARECAGIRDNTLRLHIIANSDTDEDQRLKLLVRDAILEKYSAMLRGGSKEEAEHSVEALLDDIERTANETLRENGGGCARAELVRMYFSAREYDGLTLPAGMYDALRIRIGSAEGKNWWCVMFPPLCLPAATKDADFSEELVKRFGEEGLELLRSAKKPRYKVRLAIVELFSGAGR